MKIYYKLAIAAASGLVLAVMNARPVRATDFNIVGTLANGDTFNGTYSIGNSIAANADVKQMTSLTAYNVNLFDPLGNSLGNFSSTVFGDIGVIVGDLGLYYGLVGKSDILFVNSQSELESVFSGTITTLNQPLGNNIADNTDGFAYGRLLNGLSYNNQITPLATASVTDASQSVPEPQLINSILVTSSISWLMKLKSRNSKKPKF